MKKQFQYQYIRLIFLVFIFAFSGCDNYAGHGGVTDVIKHANSPFDDINKIDSVVALDISRVLVNAKYQGGYFWTEAQKDKIERFKCSQCHQNAPVNVERASEMAHGDIVLLHGEKDKRLTCNVCHKKNERDFLVSEDGKKIDFDHSYQLCGQCHFRQKRDWIGGAHGKRMTCWAGKRTVKNCTSCHDPHSPKFAKRWPQTYSPPLTK